MKFWIGSNDVGPHGFSGLTEIDAKSLTDALMFNKLPRDTRRKDPTLRLAVVPRNELATIPGGTDPTGLKPDPKYVVEIP